MFCAHFFSHQWYRGLYLDSTTWRERRFREGVELTSILWTSISIYRDIAGSYILCIKQSCKHLHTHSHSHIIFFHMRVIATAFETRLERESITTVRTIAFLSPTSHGCTITWSLDCIVTYTWDVHEDAKESLGPLYGQYTGRPPVSVVDYPCRAAASVRWAQCTV